MQSIFPPYAGEFRKEDDLDEMVYLLKLIAEEIPVPPRPCFLYTELVEKLSVLLFRGEARVLYLQ